MTNKHSRRELPCFKRNALGAPVEAAGPPIASAPSESSHRASDGPAPTAGFSIGEARRSGVGIRQAWGSLPMESCFMVEPTSNIAALPLVEFP